MSQVFYRKYRPERFSDVIGQEHVKNILVNSIKSNNISHAYLFAGPRGTGKTTIARIFARAINFKNFDKYDDLDFEDNEFEIFKTEVIDIIEMDAASNRGIENIRLLKEGVSFVPTILRYKVYIIDEAHMLTKESFNALLKTLEEPPEHVVFIFATTEPNKLPITILSRVIRFDFQLASEIDLKSKLKHIAAKEEINATDEALDLIHKLSGGSFRDSESILSTLSSKSKKIDLELITEAFGLTSYKTIQDFTELLVSNNIEALMKLIGSLERENIDFIFFVTEVLNELINRSVKNQDVNPLHLELFTEILENISRFSNKYLYLQAKIVAALNNGTTSPTTQSEPRVESTQKKTKSPVSLASMVNKQEATVQESPKQAVEAKTVKKEVATGNPAGRTMSKLIASKLSKNNSRLAAILDASNAYVDKDNSLVIQNEFQFNLNYLSKPEMISEIKKILASIEELKEVSLIKPVKAYVEVEGEADAISEAVSPTNVVEDKIKRQPEIDNSSLVESIL